MTGIILTTQPLIYRIMVSGKSYNTESAFIEQKWFPASCQLGYPLVAIYVIIICLILSFCQYKILPTLMRRITTLAQKLLGMTLFILQESQAYHPNSLYQHVNVGYYSIRSLSWKNFDSVGIGDYYSSYVTEFQWDTTVADYVFDE